MAALDLMYQWAAAYHAVLQHLDGLLQALLPLQTDASIFALLLVVLDVLVMLARQIFVARENILGNTISGGAMTRDSETTYL